MREAEVKKCPYCGSHDIATEITYPNRKRIERLMCLACGGYEIEKEEKK